MVTVIKKALLTLSAGPSPKGVPICLSPSPRERQRDDKGRVRERESHKGGE